MVQPSVWLPPLSFSLYYPFPLPSQYFQPLPHLFPQLLHSFFFLIYLIYLFLAVLGLLCCAQAFSSCGERGLLFVVVRRLLIAVASLVAEHGL